MPAYIVAQLRFRDRVRYRRYQAAFPAVFARFQGRVVTQDEAVDRLEGDWPFDKLVILEFPSRAEALRFAHSPAYAGIAGDRKAGADSVVILAGDGG
ncbi:DUF1330 domain-containing protein [Pararhodobacter aggregans]|uniref:DUF1330 domain-containing protein n=1 Tax=Pararhodobacter aggregans TaxID=404875 RepID=A0A2T7UUQ3_9RHOB|nr:DUF1330 domain-containing protein [Pararhodobacter aggregans]PTX04149.1 uncharacterized protein (DUF1330 family) [Pararhodobacter aggregans]PVE48394.1 DUF1330 domain-containing protein [Pararhodobacter aggregans]